MPKPPKARGRPPARRERRSPWTVVAGLAALLLGVPLAVLPDAAGPYDDPKAWALPMLVAVTGLAWLASTRSASAQPHASPDRRGWALRSIVLAGLAWSAIATATSVAPPLSLLGSFGRGMGLVTIASAVLLFFVIQSRFRTAPAVRALVDVALLGSVPVCLLALAQAAGWDPLPKPWDPAVRRLTVRSTFGTHIFLGSYLVLLIPLTAARLEWACRERLESGRGWTPSRAQWLHAAVGTAWVAGAVALIGLASHWSVVWWTLVPWGIVGATLWALRAGRIEPAADSVLTASLLATLLAGQVAVVMLSRGRGAFIGMVVGLGVVVFALLIRRRAWTALAAAGLGVVCLVSFLVLLNRPDSPIASLRTVPLLTRLAHITNVEMGTPGWVRLQVWKGIADGWSRQLRGEGVIPGLSPLARSFIGYGPESQLIVLDLLTASFVGAFPASGEGWRAQYTFDRAHNVMLDHLVTEGLVGAGLWVLLVGCLLVVGLRRIRTGVSPGEAAIRLGALGALLGHLAEGQVGITTPMALAVFWLTAALLTSEPWLPPLPATSEALGWPTSSRRWWIPALAVAALCTVLVGWIGTRWLLASLAFADGTRRVFAGRLEDAYRDFRRSVALAPWLPLPAESAATTAWRLAARETDPARRLRLLHEAETALAQSRRYTMGRVGSWGLTGQIAFAQARAGERGQLATSRDAFAAALRLRPGDASLLAQWALVWLESGDARQAREAAQRALARDPREWLAWAVLARASTVLGDPAAAERALAHARQLAPWDSQRRLDALFP